MNMRAALPNASFLAFTGTPLLAGEERTREVFGDYVSVYDFQRSIDEGATVKLYYENRIPELQLANEHFEEDLERLLEEAELDAAQEERLEGEFARQYHLITRDDRLEKIARDLVRHFPNRGFLGKGMVVSIDKATTVRLHDKVRAAWDEEIADLRRRLEGAPTPEADTLRARLLWMEETDMAVVVSQSEDEAAKMRAKGADIAPHRARLEREPGIDEHFKDPGHPLRLVFICSMWLTGFDVESCSTLYLDKPMRNHTLMQAIARANRRFEGKGCGLIVDYVGVFAHLQDALAIYGKGESGAMPVSPKAELLAKLREKIAEIENLLRTHGIDLDALSYTERYADVAAMDRRATQALLDAANRLSRERTVKDDFLGRARHVGRLYRAILPDPMAGEVTPRCALIERLAEILRVNSERADISEVMRAVERLLDDSISASESYVIQNRPALRPLTAHSADTLRQRFENGWEHLLVDRLERDLVDKARDLARRNPSRRRLVERLEQLIADYNAGAQGAAEYFEKLLALLGEMTKEEARGLREELSEEELAIFDLLHPPKGLSKKEETRVKAAARNLVETLKTGKLTLDWRKRETTRAAVHMAIQETLDAHLQEETFPKDVFDAVCGAVYEHVFEAYHDDGHSVYAERPPEGGG